MIGSEPRIRLIYCNECWKKLPAQSSWKLLWKLPVVCQERIYLHSGTHESAYSWIRPKTCQNVVLDDPAFGNCWDRSRDRQIDKRGHKVADWGKLIWRNVRKSRLSGTRLHNLSIEPLIRFHYCGYLINIARKVVFSACQKVSCRFVTLFTNLLRSLQVTMPFTYYSLRFDLTTISNVTNIHFVSLS